MNLLEKTIDRVNDYGNGSVLESVKRAFIFLTPMFVIGASALTLQSFPVTVIRNFIETALGGKIFELLQTLYVATAAAVYLVLSVAYCVSEHSTVHVDARMFCCLTSLVCYIAFLGPTILGGESGEILAYLNMSNVFSALIASLASSKLFIVLYNALNSGKTDRTTAFTRAVHSTLPLLICLAIFATAAVLIDLIPSANNFNDLMLTALAKPFESLGATFFGGFAVILIESILWVFGIHGSNVFEPILTDPSGAFAFSGGNIATKAFFDTYALMGGCGTTICLFIAILVFSKNRRRRSVCKLGGIPLIFNINELLVFGVPVVLNPVFLIPFVSAPLVCYSVAYFATAVGIVPQIVNAGVQWTTPVLISGYQATGSIAGSLLQLFLIAVGVAIYVPFVLLDNRLAARNESEYVRKLTDVCKKCERSGVPYSLAKERLALRTFEDLIAKKLKDDIDGDAIPLKYQPQVENGKIVAAESLLRFSYGNAGCVYPPLVIGIATNAGLFEDLTRAITRRALADLTEAQKIDPSFKIAVNLTLELLMQDSFRAWLIEEVGNSAVTPHTFGVELTEDAKLSDSVDYRQIFDEIKAAGMEILMDDFSMGHTSVSILQKNVFDYVKIDGNLIKHLDNDRSRSIVSSIVNLGKTLNFGVVAEFVETEAQRDALKEMGCNIYQGYLYYKDVPAAELNALLTEQTHAEATED